MMQLSVHITCLLAQPQQEGEKHSAVPHVLAHLPAVQGCRCTLAAPPIFYRLCLLTANQRAQYSFHYTNRRHDRYVLSRAQRHAPTDLSAGGAFAARIRS
jgi:hypothetical protein